MLSDPRKRLTFGSVIIVKQILKQIVKTRKRALLSL